MFVFFTDSQRISVIFDEVFRQKAYFVTVSKTGENLRLPLLPYANVSFPAGVGV